MAEPFYRIGEERGPFIVTESKFEFLGNGRTLEYVKDSGGNFSTTYGWDDDREYYPICQRTGDILVPYTVRHASTERGAPNATWEYVGNSDYDYWRVLCEWWKPRDFTVIEHDVEASPEIFKEFDACPHVWCTFRYSNHTPEDAKAWEFGILGCTRFRAAIIKKVPNAATGMEWRYRGWRVMSTGLGRALREARFTPHLHGIVDHHRMMDRGGVAVLMAS